MDCYIGVDVGGTNIACGIVDCECGIIARSKVKTNERGKDRTPAYEDVLEEVQSGDYPVGCALDRDRLPRNVQQ